MPATNINVANPGTGMLVIPGFHDGGCAVQHEEAAVTVAFRWSRAGKRPELAVGSPATLDGVACEVRSVTRSGPSTGFYVAVLKPQSRQTYQPIPPLPKVRSC